MNVMLSKTFFPQHPKAGELTGFREKVLKGEKRHTCRCNYEYWKDRIATLNQKGSVQEPILDIGSGIVDVQQLVMERRKLDEPEYVEVQPGMFQPRTAYEYFARVDGEPYDVEFIAKNDGLSLEDFKAWFNPVFDEEKEDRLTFAVIHFSTFRY